MLKKSVGGVLASLRGSTYRSVCLASSFAAALLDSLFEHPAPFGEIPTVFLCVIEFSCNLLEIVIASLLGSLLRWQR